MGCVFRLNSLVSRRSKLQSRENEFLLLDSIFTVVASGVRVSDEAPKAVESSSLEMECTASGIPVPEVAWLRNFEIVENQKIGEGRSTLLFRTITAADAGLYTCRATNTVNRKMRSMEGYSSLEGETRLNP